MDSLIAPFRTGDLPGLYVRADGGAAIGLGHVMRCLALAHVWRAAGGRVTWLSTPLEEPVRRRIEAAGARLVPVEAAHPDPRDLGATLRVLAGLRADGADDRAAPWLAIDGHAFDADYLASARRAGWRTLVIDDNGWLPRYDCDVLLNPNVGQRGNSDQVSNRPYQSDISYATPPDTARLCGLDYVLLRPEFARWRGWRRETPPVARRLLVMLGGSDPANVTPRVVRALSQCGLAGLEVRVVVGPANPRRGDVESAIDAASAALGGEADVRLLADPGDLSEWMAWADLCVTAAGSACWELAFMGLPSLAIVVAENQVRSVVAAERAGLLVNLGRQEGLDEARLADAIQGLAVDTAARERFSLRGRELVDGRGVERVLAVFAGM